MENTIETKVENILMNQEAFDNMMLRHTQQYFASYPIYKDSDNNLYLLRRIKQPDNKFLYDGSKITITIKKQ